jgi:hypothetical protein
MSSATRKARSSDWRAFSLAQRHRVVLIGRVAQADRIQLSEPLARGV